jgi:hypothetical protein
MNERENDPIDVLRRHVERTVAPLSAGRRRKARVREELLAHLIGVYEQESARAPRAAALDATLRRFGDRDDLTRQLQASVPPFERILVILFSKERRMWRWLVVGGFVASLFGTSMVLPALAKLQQQADLHHEPYMALAVALMIGMVIAVAGLHLLAWGIARRLRRTSVA